MEHFKYDKEDDRYHVDLTRQIHLEMAGLVNCPKGWTGKVHAHPFWELIFINSGQGEYKLKAKGHPVQRDGLFLIPPLLPHQFVNTGKEKVELLYIGFSFEVQTFGGPNTAGSPLLKLEPLGNALPGKFRQLIEVFKSSKPGPDAYRNQALIFEIIYTLMDFIENHPDLSRDLSVNKSGVIADQAKKFLQSNIHKTISVEEVATMFYLSPHYFSKKFKAETGMGIKEYHNQVRMKKAVELLRDPLLSISEIADRLGFSNVNYFTNKFREFHRTSPTEHRKKLAQSLADS